MGFGQDFVAYSAAVLNSAFHPSCNVTAMAYYSCCYSCDHCYYISIVVQQEVVGYVYSATIN